MKAKDYVNSLFAGYEETQALADFKEELLSNLCAKIESMVKKGADEKAAFDKAIAELGDVSALANEISLKKRQEVFEERYLDTRHYMKPGRVLGYILCGISLIFGVIVALIVYLTEQEHFGLVNPALPRMALPPQYLAGVFGSLLPFVAFSAIGITYLALTQETPASNPMSRKRALWYTLAVLVLVSSVILTPLIYFSTGGRQEGIIGALGAFVAIALPAAGLLCFLILTEKDRLKPWARERRNNQIYRIRELFASPAVEMRFGLLSGAIWIFALALFLITGFAVSFKFSWILFIIAAGMECLILALMSRKNAGKN